MRSLFLVILLISIQSSFAQMILSGTATGFCDCYTLTNTTGQGGSVWSPTTIDLTNPFDFTFQINLGSADAGGADGMVFVLRKTGTFTGGIGTDLGYTGILNSIGIEVDTWDSGIGIGDIPADHIGMHSNGAINHNLVPAIGISNIEDGLTHDFRVVWDPVALQLETFLDGTSMFVYTGDLVTSFFGGDPNVYFGWTAATGGASNVQTVCIEIEAYFSVADLLVCPGQELEITNTSVSGLIYDGIGVTTWAWTFGGGATSAVETPTYSYLTEGLKIIGLTVTNMIGCTDLVTLGLNVDSIDIAVSATHLTCFEADDGTATATGLTGEAPFTFLWDDPLAQTTSTAVGLAAGIYSVTVTDNAGCQKTRSVVVTQPDELLIPGEIITNATCGLADGELELVVSGGTPPFEYSIDGGLTFVPATIFVDLAAGSYDIVIRDDNGCTNSKSILIGSEPLDITVTKTDVTCFGFDNGTATAIPAFGVGPCTYLWDDPLNQTTPTAVDLAPGTYTALVMHIALGCAGTATITITEPTLFEFGDIALVNASCGVSNGQIAIEAIGGTLPYEYSVDGGISFFPSPLFNGLAPGTYTIVAKDDYGCLTTMEVTIINVSNVPTVNISANPREGCKALEVELTNLSDPLLTNVTTWDFGDGTTGTGTTVNHTYTIAGCYDVHVSILTFDGCTTEDLFTDYICVWELPIANFESTPDQPDILHTEVKFENLSSFASMYEWDFGDGATSTAVDPIHNYAAVGGVTYYVELIAITDKGCHDTIQKTVHVDEVVLYFIPNSFTPTSDPFNPDFRIYFIPGFEPLDFHFQIFNRWGEVLWESYNPAAIWNGTYNGLILEDGVYIWKLEFRENSTDVKHEDFGHITIIK